MAYGLQFRTGNNKTFDIADIGPATYLGQINKSGTGSVSRSFSGLVGKASRLIIVPNLIGTNGYRCTVSVNNSSMSVTITVAAYGGYQSSATPNFSYDMYGVFN